MADDMDETRRIFLLRVLAAGLFAVSPLARADLLGNVPHELPAGKSIYSLQGSLRINGQVATTDTVIGNNDTLVTSAGSQAIFVVGKDAFMLRENSELQLSGDNLLVDGLRLVTGALLSVFGKSRHRIETPTATIGIRGTGLYVESQPDLTYVCTCYGTTDIGVAADPGKTETIESKHHDAPRYVTVDGRINPAPMFNHTDEELMLIEALVGRTAPFALFDDSYGGPKRY
ncbi:MAG: hypothetical protein A2Z94_01200 [Gallionellales bacterium GWA2_55_18]|nr:MAG: hypothetical protein A2Z94_01200 [Gallionellales bacterium GWA2_55_18]